MTMAIQEFLGRREFRTTAEIKQFIERSKRFDPEVEDPGEAKALLFFETDKQHTWLVATPVRVYCILDDVRKPLPHINWSMPSDQAFEGDQFALQLDTHKKSARTGLIDFGPKHKRWLYSKGLFQDDPVSDTVRSFLTNAMAKGSFEDG